MLDDLDDEMSATQTSMDRVNKQMNKLLDANSAFAANCMRATVGKFLLTQ